MAQVIALCNFEQTARVMQCIQALLSEDESVAQECVAESLAFVRRALNVSPLRDLVFTEEDLEDVGRHYRQRLEQGSMAVEEAMFCSLHRLRLETGTALVDSRITGPDLGYGIRYFTAMRALGLVALIWQVNRFGQDVILNQAQLLKACR